MKRVAGRTWLGVAAMAIVVAAAQVAEAQREDRGGRGFGGPGGPGGRGMPPSAVRLAAMNEVQKALNLSDEQRTKVEEVNEEVRDKARQAFEDRRGGDFRQMRSEMDKINNEATAELSEVLDEQQKKKLAAIAIQVNDAGAVNDPLVADVLELSDEQKSKLADARDEQMREMRDQFQELRDLSSEERRAKFEDMRSKSQEKFLAVLTSEQQSQFESLKGEPVDLDVSRLRGPRGFEGRERRGDRPRGDRERGRERRERRGDNPI